MLKFVTGVAVVALSSCSSADREAKVTAATSSSSPSTTQASATTVVAPASSEPTAATEPLSTPGTDVTESTELPVTLPPTTAPQLVDDESSRIWAYLRSNFADAPWLGAIRRIEVRAGEAFVTTAITPDGRGEVLAGQACSAVLGNDQVALSQVTVGATGGATAAACQR